MRTLGFLLTAAVLLAATGLSAGEVGNRRMVFAHNTPWFSPADASLFADWYFNYPLAHVPDGPTKAEAARKLDVRDALRAGLDGMFLDFGASGGDAPCTWWWTLGPYLRAAEGTDFQVGMCLDVPSSAAYWGNEIVRILKQNGNHPNYPKCGGKYVLCTYVFLQMSPETWRGIRRIAKDAGFELYVIANVAPLPREKLDLTRLDRYRDCFDCLYMFDSPEHAAEPPRVNNRILSGYCAKGGKRFMPCLHPGYYGAWLVCNDFYSPFRGVDVLWDTFDAARGCPAADWFHVTTWNDLMETAVLERAYTFGQASLVRYFAGELKGLKPKAEEPEVFVAYHREELPGTLLRIEAAGLPCRSEGPLSVSGRLLAPDGSAVRELEARPLDPAAFTRVEWLVPTAELARWPELTPEFTVRNGASARTVKAPDVYLVSSWLQNAVTVNVPLSRMTEDFENRLEVTRSGPGIRASVAFASPEPVRRATLMRNDRPLAVFTSSAPTNEYAVSVTVEDVGTPSDLVIRNGRVLRAVKKGQSKANPECLQFDWNETSIFTDNTDYGPIGATFAGRADAAVTIRPRDGTAPATVSLLELSERQVVRTPRGTLAVRPDVTHLDAPPLGLRKATLAVSVHLRVFRPSDRYFVRYETMSGKVFMTPTVHPFAKGEKPVRLPLLETETSLETSSGCSGLCYLGKNEFLTPYGEIPAKGFRVRAADVSPLVNRRIYWAFDGSGAEESGNFCIGGNLAKFLTDDGFSGGGLAFPGKPENLCLPFRAWPIGGFGHLGFRLNPDAFTGAKQSVVYKDGWTDGLSVALLPTGEIEVTREYNVDPGKESVHGSDVLTGRTRLTPGRWTHVEIDGTAAELVLRLDGREDGRIPLKPIRSFGNGHVYLGGTAPDAEPYRGRLDELEIEGLPQCVR